MCDVELTARVPLKRRKGDPKRRVAERIAKSIRGPSWNGANRNRGALRAHVPKGMQNLEAAVGGPIPNKVAVDIAGEWART